MGPFTACEPIIQFGPLQFSLNGPKSPIWLTLWSVYGVPIDKASMGTLGCLKNDHLKPSSVFRSIWVRFSDLSSSSNKLLLFPFCGICSVSKAWSVQEVDSWKKPSGKYEPFTLIYVSVDLSSTTGFHIQVRLERVDRTVAAPIDESFGLFFCVVQIK